jgi:adenine-specific DNA-methyltransferase
MTKDIDIIETSRVVLQEELDGQKTQAERNRLGQFATPTALAQDILQYAATLLPPGQGVRFFDPAIGTGAFYSALRKVFPEERIEEAMGFEIDPHYAKPGAQLWADSTLTIKLSDFTHAEDPKGFNLIICNPPYVRHHHLKNGNKARLQLRTQQASGMKISGLAGLYCHFLGLAHSWMTDGGIAGWLIPSEFMDVNYGRAVKRYLLEQVTLLRIHRFDPNDVQFADALVSSAIVWFRKSPPPADHSVTFTFGGKLLAPKLTRIVSASAIANESKWTRFPAADVRSLSQGPILSEFFKVKRGLATGDNSYFILSEEKIIERGFPLTVFKPILPSPRYLPGDQVNARIDGTPDIERRLFLLDTRLSEDEIRKTFPALYRYLEEGKEQDMDKGYLCRHRRPWYSQENRPPPPIVCTYIGRSDTKSGRPFRFILNKSQATVANVYLAMYPTARLARGLEADPTLIERVWTSLNLLTADELLREGRVYGGGLHKLEPRELGNVDASVLDPMVPELSMSMF